MVPVFNDKRTSPSQKADIRKFCYGFWKGSCKKLCKEIPARHSCKAFLHPIDRFSQKKYVLAKFNNSQQRKLMGSSAQNNSGVHYEVPEKVWEVTLNRVPENVP